MSWGNKTKLARQMLVKRRRVIAVSAAVVALAGAGGVFVVGNRSAASHRVTIRLGPAPPGGGPAAPKATFGQQQVSMPATTVRASGSRPAPSKGTAAGHAAIGRGVNPQLGAGGPSDTNSIGTVPSKLPTGTTSPSPPGAAPSIPGLPPGSLPPTTPPGTPTSPSAPQNVVVLEGDDGVSAQVFWSPPSQTGGSPIQSYQIAVNPGRQPIEEPDAARAARVGGLQAGGSYTVAVTAVNQSGLRSSPASASLYMGNPFGPAPGWSMYQANAQHTGESSDSGPLLSGTLRSIQQPQSTDILNPVVGPEEVLTATPNLGALSVGTLAPLWNVNTSTYGNTGAYTHGAPAVAADGTAYLSARYVLTAIDYGGEVKWQDANIPTTNYDSPTIGPDGIVYVTEGNAVTAVDPRTGHQLWTYTGPNPYPTDEPVTAVALSNDGKTVYLADWAGGLYALRAGAEGGQLLWSHSGTVGKNPPDLAGAPIVGPDGTVYVNSSNDGSGGPSGEVQAVNPDGSTKWVFQGPDGGFVGSPSLTPSGLLLVNDGSLVALDAATGKQEWTRSAAPESGSESGYTEAAVDRNGTIYVQVDRQLLALSESGSVLGALTDGFGWYTSAMCLDGGYLYSVGTARTSPEITNEFIQVGGT